MNKGVVYALWEYEAQSADELSFQEGDAITVLRRKDDAETDWWWSKLNDKEGYVPRNLLGVGPRPHVPLNRIQYAVNSMRSMLNLRLFVYLQLYPRIKPRQRSLA